jgi:predicted CopG family antitoxin
VSVRTITVTEEAYLRLRGQKGPEESFSEVIIRLTARRPLASFVGALSKQDARAMWTRIQKDRMARARLDQGHAPRN